MKMMISSIGRTVVVASVLVLAVAVFSACNKDNDSNADIPVAGLMAFNLSPDNSAVGIELSGNQLVNAPLAYTNYTGTYYNIYPGDRSLESYDYTKDTTLAKSNFNFGIKKYYSLFVVGNNGSYKNVVVRDDFDSLSNTSTQAFVRYINAIPDSSAPTVTITANGSNVVNAAAPYTTVSEFTPVSGGDVNIAVTNGAAISKNRTIALQNGKAYTVLLVGIPAATDTTKAVQIKFIENGTVTDSEDK